MEIRPLIKFPVAVILCSFGFKAVGRKCLFFLHRCYRKECASLDKSDDKNLGRMLLSRYTLHKTIPHYASLAVIVDKSLGEDASNQYGAECC